MATANEGFFAIIAKQYADQVGEDSIGGKGRKGVKIEVEREEEHVE